MKFSTFIFLFILAVFLVAAGRMSSGQQDRGGGFAPDNTLTVPHAAIDPATGDLLIISNSWRNVRQNLRRYSADGEPVAGFVIERYDSCCAIHPFLVAV